MMLWGCFVSSGTGRLLHIKGKMNAIMYKDILANNIHVSARQLHLGQSWVFQHDNNPKHTVKRVIKMWLDMKCIHVLE